MDDFRGVITTTLKETILYLHCDDLLLQRQSGGFEYFQLLFLVRYPNGKCLILASELIPLILHFLKGFYTEKNK